MPDTSDVAEQPVEKDDPEKTFEEVFAEKSPRGLHLREQGLKLALGTYSAASISAVLQAAKLFSQYLYEGTTNGG